MQKIMKSLKTFPYYNLNDTTDINQRRLRNVCRKRKMNESKRNKIVVSFFFFFLCVWECGWVKKKKKVFKLRRKERIRSIYNRQTIQGVNFIHFYSLELILARYVNIISPDIVIYILLRFLSSNMTNSNERQFWADRFV